MSPLGEERVTLHALLTPGARRLDVEASLLILRLSLGLPEVDDGLHLPVGDEDALQARGLARLHRQVEHVAAAQQFLRPGFVEDYAGIDAGADGERDPGGDVRLDQTGNDVGRGTL